MLVIIETLLAASMDGSDISASPLHAELYHVQSRHTPTDETRVELTTTECNASNLNPTNNSGNSWKGGRDPHPQDFSLTKKTARFTILANFVLTKDRNRPYYGHFCGKIHREGSCSKAASADKLRINTQNHGRIYGKCFGNPNPYNLSKSTAVHLPFVRQYAPHLYRRTFLASKLRRKGNPATRLPFVLQYAPHLYGSTPPICTAVLLEKYWGLGRWGHQNVSEESVDGLAIAAQLRCHPKNPASKQLECAPFWGWVVEVQNSANSDLPLPHGLAPSETMV